MAIPNLLWDPPCKCQGRLVRPWITDGDAGGGVAGSKPTGNHPSMLPSFHPQSLRITPPGQRLAREDRWCAGRKVAPAPLW